MRTEDGQIIQECLNGEPEAFGVLVDKYKEGIYAFVYAKLGNFRDAQDVTQEVFLKAYRDLHSLKRWESFAFWLYRIAYARCAELLRAKSKRIDLDFIEDQDSKTIDASSLDYYREYQLSESVRDALDSLPEAYREVLMLHYFGGINSNEIANALGTSPTAIRMRLSRARAQLKEEMITMIGTVFEEQKLRIGFTFHIVEAIKQIRIQPVSPKILPWGLSLATGIIVIFLSLGTSLNLPYTIGALSGSPIPGETKVLKIGEIPVDAIKVSNISVISNQRLNGNGLGSGLPNMQNALFMGPQADGGTWTKRTDMPTARILFFTSEVNGKIYAIGGYDGIKELSTVEEYDPMTDKWVRKADMPTSRIQFSGCAVNGKIYAIGGSNDKSYFSIVEEYDPEASENVNFKGKLPTTWGEMRTAMSK